MNLDERFWVLICTFMNLRIEKNIILKDLQIVSLLDSWGNGSLFDSRSKSCVFDSHRIQIGLAIV